MRIEIKGKKFLINLPNRLFAELVDFNKLHERMDLDLSTLILHFIIKKQSEPQEWIPLYSVTLRKFNYGKFKTHEQIELLKEGGFIEYLNHQNNISGKENSSRKFRVALKYFDQEFIQHFSLNIYTYEIKTQPLLKRIEKHSNRRKIEAEASTPHLTKWLNMEDFSMDDQSAINYIDKEYGKDSFGHLVRYSHIINFNSAQTYSRDGRDDRFHSLFTQLPRDLKSFVRYKGQQLVEADIKSSQPLMFAILLEKILNHYYELQDSSIQVTEIRLNNRIRKTLIEYINNIDMDYYNNKKYVIDIDQISYNITIILLKTLKTLDFAEIKDFISLVKSGSIYEDLADYLLSEGVIWKEGNKYFARLYNKAKNIQKDSAFETLRDGAKKILLNALYSPKGKGSIKVINKVKDYYSLIFQIADAFKAKCYEDFSLILQRMEAKCVLDHCAKNIAMDFPDMPLITRHDSISTTEQFGDILYDEFQKHIQNYFGTAVKSEKQIW